MLYYVILFPGARLPRGPALAEVRGSRAHMYVCVYIYIYIERERDIVM